MTNIHERALRLIVNWPKDYPEDMTPEVHDFAVAVLLLPVNRVEQMLTGLEQITRRELGWSDFKDRDAWEKALSVFLSQLEGANEIERGHWDGKAGRD